MTLDESGIRERLRGHVRSFKRAKLAAEAMGISEPYLSQLLSGARPMSARIARQIGFKPSTMWSRISA